VRADVVQMAEVVVELEARRVVVELARSFCDTTPDGISAEELYDRLWDLFVGRKT
jgi:hypothetical protein